MVLYPITRFSQKRPSKRRCAFARLFCPVGTLLLVGTLLMALNFCEKTSGEQTLQICSGRSQKVEQAFIFCVSSGQLLLGKLGVKEREPSH